jgi:hypothetical protein
MSLSRRRFFAFTAGAGAIAAAQQTAPPAPAEQGGDLDPRMAAGNVDKLFKYSQRRSTVSLIKGDNRRKNIFDSLVAIDAQIRPVLNRKKYVIIGPAYSYC